MYLWELWHHQKEAHVFGCKKPQCSNKHTEIFVQTIISVTLSSDFEGNLQHCQISQFNADSQDTCYSTSTAIADASLWEPEIPSKTFLVLLVRETWSKTWCTCTLGFSHKMTKWIDKSNKMLLHYYYICCFSSLPSWISDWQFWKT